MPEISGNPEYFVFFIDEVSGKWSKIGFKLERAAKRFMQKNPGSFLKRFCAVAKDGSTKFTFDTQSQAIAKAQEIGGMVTPVAPPPGCPSDLYYS